MIAERATKKQQELFTFVKSFLAEHDYSPSYREIMTALGYKSVSTVAVHLDALISKGYLKRGDTTARSLEVVTDTTRESNTPKTVLSSDDIVKKIDELIKLSDSQESVEILIKALEIIGRHDDADAARKKLNTEQK